MLSPNTILQGRYRVVRQLGQGGMGTVYEAVDQRFESQVALKETHFKEESLRKQFEREARLLNKLRHPAMTRVIDHFTEGDGQFLVMDFVEGEDLWEMLQARNGPFPAEQVLVWGEQLLDALDYIHSQQHPIIHRDIKPQNLKLTERGQIILLDFGLAKGSTGHMTTVVTSRSVLGYSLAYAPPEQILKVEQHWVDLLSVSNAEQVQEILRRGTDSRSDLYSLSATLLHLLTGKAPANAPTRALSVWTNRPDPLEAAFDSNVPERIAAVLRKAMALMMDERYGTAKEMLQDWRAARQPMAHGSLDTTIAYVPPVVASPTPQPLPKAEERPSANQARTLAATPPTPPASVPAKPSDVPARAALAGRSSQSRAVPIIVGVAILLVVAIIIIASRKGTDSYYDTSNSANASTGNSASTSSSYNDNASSTSTTTVANESSTSSSSSNESDEPETVTVRLTPSMSDPMGVDETYPDLGATVVSSDGEESKRLGSASSLSFEVPCGETIKITIWDDSRDDDGLTYSEYIPCGQSVINLGYMRFSAA